MGLMKNPKEYLSSIIKKILEMWEPKLDDAFID